MNWLDKRFLRTRTEEAFVSYDECRISDREERNGTSSAPETNSRWFYTELDFNAWLVEEDRPGQGSHARGSFVKKGGDWRCVSAKEPKPLPQQICWHAEYSDSVGIKACRYGSTEWSQCVCYATIWKAPWMVDQEMGFKHEWRNSLLSSQMLCKWDDGRFSLNTFLLSFRMMVRSWSGRSVNMMMAGRLARLVVSRTEKFSVFQNTTKWISALWSTGTHYGRLGLETLVQSVFPHSTTTPIFFLDIVLLIATNCQKPSRR